MKQDLGGWYLRLNQEIRYRDFEFEPSCVLFDIFTDEYRDDAADYFLYSPHIDRHEEKDDAIKIAAEIGLLINGIFDVFQVSSRLKLSSHEFIRSDNLSRVGIVNIRPPTQNFRMPYQAIDPSWDRKKYRSDLYRNKETENFCILAIMNKKIMDISLTFGYNGVGWASLYAALDHLAFRESEPAFREGEMANRYSVEKSTIKRFKHTANSYISLGPASRHGDNNQAPPPNPMSLGEAQTLIMGMIRKEAEILSAEGEFQRKVHEIFGLGTPLGC